MWAADAGEGASVEVIGVSGLGEDHASGVLVDFVGGKAES